MPILMIPKEQEDELMHYGVKGMKWGQRKAYKYANKASLARSAAEEWEAKAQATRSKRSALGRNSKIAKYEKKAALERNRESIYDRKSKGIYSKRSDKLKEKSRSALDDAKKWDEKSKAAASKGRTQEALKYKQKSDISRHNSEHYIQKSKKIIENRLKKRQVISEISADTKKRGREMVARLRSNR